MRLRSVRLIVPCFVLFAACASEKDSEIGADSDTGGEDAMGGGDGSSAGDTNPSDTAPLDTAAPGDTAEASDAGSDATTDAASDADPGDTGADSGGTGVDTPAAILASFDPAGCTPGAGCSAATLADFDVTWNQCRLTKVGDAVTLSRRAIPAIVGSLSSVQSNSLRAGGSLTVNVGGSIGDSISFSIAEATGTFAGISGASLVSSRSIDCGAVFTEAFPALPPNLSATTLEEVFGTFDGASCTANSNGVAYNGCAPASLPDFSVTYAGCTLSKSGADFTVVGADGTTGSLSAAGALQFAVSETASVNAINEPPTYLWAVSLLTSRAQTLSFGWNRSAGGPGSIQLVDNASSPPVSIRCQ